MNFGAVEFPLQSHKFRLKRKIDDILNFSDVPKKSAEQLKNEFDEKIQRQPLKLQS